jgi:hypothetical protein
MAPKRETRSRSPERRRDADQGPGNCERVRQQIEVEVGPEQGGQQEAAECQERLLDDQPGAPVRQHRPRGAHQLGERVVPGDARAAVAAAPA